MAHVKGIAGTLEIEAMLSLGVAEPV